MKFKSLISLLLSICMIFGFSGCGDTSGGSKVSGGSSKNETINSSVNDETNSFDESNINSDISSEDAVSDNIVSEDTNIGATSFDNITDDSLATENIGSVDTSLSTVNVNKDFSPITSVSDIIMQDNPDRGFRTHLTLNIKDAVDSGNPMNYFLEKYNVFFAYCDMEINVSMTYFYLTDYRGMDIPDEAMDAIDQFFQFSEGKGFTNCLRFAYCDDYKELDRGADQATIIRHIKQLAPLIKKYKHCVHTCEGGFIGSYGEWAPNYQRPAVDYETITKYLMKYFCMPNGIYLSLRMPEYKNLLDKSSPYWKYIGYHNDAMFGETDKEGWNSAGYQYGTPEWEQVCLEGAYTPQGGEMLNNDDYYEKEKIPVGIEMIKEAGHHWQNTMSVWHGRYESVGDNEAIMNLWEAEEVTPEILESSNVVYDPYWFIDDNGNPVQRNAFEFLRDHLGYRISLQSVKTTGENKKESTISAELSLKNYGFSAAFCMQSGFAILDSNYDVVREVKAGSPSKWYSHDPENYLNTEILTHSVSAEIKLPSESGKYYLAFYLKNGINQFASFANSIESAGGYAILHEFEL